MAQVTLRNLGKTYEGGTAVLDGIDIEIQAGELLVLVGPSGCGKSTLLRMIAGLEEPSHGEIRIGGRVVNALPSAQRDIAMVFQDYALYPHMTARENLAFGLKVRGTSRARIEEQVARAAELLGLEQLLDRKPAQLSGGQRQRVAIGRAIVRKPAVFLFDEPLSNLDAQLRTQTRVELAALHRKLGATTIYVTHDQTEAMTLADRIVVLDRGRVQQVGAPLELYDRPANRFVASFIGNPGMNFLQGSVGPGGDFESGSLRIGQASANFAGSVAGERVLGVRPEGLLLGSAAVAAPDFQALIVAIEPLGHETMIALELPGKVAWMGRVSAEEGARFRAGELVPLRIERSRIRWFSPADGASGT